MPLTSCLQSQDTMPAVWDTMIEKELLSPSQTPKNSNKDGEDKQASGNAGSYRDVVSFIPFAPTNVKHRRNSLVQKMLTCYIAP